MLFQRDTRSKTKTIKAPPYSEHYSVVQLTQKTTKKKKKLSSDLRSSWKLREAVGSADEDSDGISDETGHYIADLTDHATYARSLGFPEPFPEYVFHLEEAEVQERLNRSLEFTSVPVDSHFSTAVEVGPCRWSEMSSGFLLTLPFSISFSPFVS
jgi:hypothetical protein